MKITIYNEFKHEREDKECAAVYPQGIHAVLADFIQKGISCEIQTFTVDNVNEQLTDEVLDHTDVLLWWGHVAHNQVSDETAWRVHNHVLRGMGAIFLHSAHMSKPFRFLMGTGCTLRWGEGVKEILWVTDPIHPIVKDIPPKIVLPEEEFYGEHFDIPAPDSLVFTSWFASGHVFRSGCAYKRGMGRIFYFQPGHETYPTYKNPVIQKIILNAIDWVQPVMRTEIIDGIHDLDVE